MNMDPANAVKVLIVVALFACSNANATKQDVPARKNSAKTAAKPVATPEIANWATPLEKYQRLDDWLTVALLYAALQNDPVDYSEFATWMLDGYASTNDVFKKHEMEQSLKPQIDPRIQNFKRNRYVIYEEPLKLGDYRFDIKGFVLENQFVRFPTAVTGSREHEDWVAALENVRAEAFLPMADIDKAKAIDQLKKTGKLKGWTVKSYAWAGWAGYSVERGGRVVQLYIHKVVVLDDKKNVIGEFVVPDSK